MFNFINITPKNYLTNIEHLTTTRQPIVLTPSADSLHAEHSIALTSTTTFVQDKILNVYVQAQQSGCDMNMRDFLQSVLHGCEEIKYLLKGLGPEYATHAADATHFLEKPKASLPKYKPERPSLTIPSSSKKSNTSNLRAPLKKAQKNGGVKKQRGSSRRGRNTYTPEFLNHMHLMVAGPYNFYISANKILKLYKIPSCAEILNCINQEITEEIFSLPNTEKKKKLVQFLLKKCIEEHQAGRGVPVAGKSVFQYTISLEKRSLIMLIHFSEDKHFNCFLHTLMFNIIDIYVGKTAEECYEHIKIFCNTPPICTEEALKENIETFDTSMFNMAAAIPHAGEIAQHFTPIYLEAPNVIHSVTHATEAEERASLQSFLPQDPYYGNVSIEQPASSLNVTEEEHLQYILDLLEDTSLPVLQGGGMHVGERCPPPTYRSL